MLNNRELLALRADVISNVLAGFQPDVFLVDHMPHGALGELLKPLAELRRQRPRTKIILGIRDILGAPEVIRRQWESEGAFAAIEEFYDAVCIYGSSDLFDAATEYQFPLAVRGRVRYCGYVCRDEAQIANTDGATLAPSNGRSGKKFVLITGGGGADAAYMMDRFIDAVRLLKTEISFQAFIATGPFVHKEQRKLLRQKSQDLPITVGRMEGDSIRYFRRADLVVSMAGYNTISEIMLFRKNALVVPRPGPSAEQTMRTRLMAQRALFTTIAPQALTGENMAEQLSQQLRTGQKMPEAHLPDLRGAGRVAEFILQDGI
ncbi:MAG: glycosyltransferase [candidate division KSB1 bacterium]